MNGCSSGALVCQALLPQLRAQLGPILLGQLAWSLVAVARLLLRLQCRTQVSPATLCVVCGNMCWSCKLIVACTGTVPARSRDRHQAAKDKKYSRGKASVHGALTYGAIARNTLLCCQGRPDAVYL